MELTYIVVLALIQGLTEFLPISSSAHLILPAQLLGWSDQGLAFDVAVHVGTLLAVLLYFRRDFYLLGYGWTRSLSRGKCSLHSRMAWAVILGTLPAVLAGIMLDSLIEQHLRSILVIAMTTLIFGAVLQFADWRRAERRKIRDLKLRDVLLIGCAQAIALIPGTSRSGVTISAGLMLGMTRQAAARFSFYLAAPLITGAGLFKGLQLVEQGESAPWFAVGLGTLIAALSAYACIHLFLRLLDKIGMLPFVLYRMVLGVVLLGIYWSV